MSDTSDSRGSASNSDRPQPNGRPNNQPEKPLGPAPPQDSPQSSPHHAYELWRAGETPDARAEIDRRRRNGQVVSKKEFVDLAYEGYAASVEQGLYVDPRKYPDLFPTFHESVRRVIEVHEYLESVLGPALPMTDDDWPKVGEEILEYELVELIGRGVRARVYLAQNTHLGRLEVVKVSCEMESFNEAYSQGKLSHENIVPVLQVENDPSCKLNVIAMPYLGRATLANVIAEFLYDLPGTANHILEVIQTDDVPAKSPVLSGAYLEAATEIGWQIASGLAAAHDAGVIHGDIKPSNVLMTPAGRAMLLDFNLARNDQEEWQPPTTGGTLPYLSPEQLQSRRDSHNELLHQAEDEGRLMEGGDEEEAPPPAIPPSRKTDLYALGVILYELHTGHYPFAPWPDFTSDPIAGYDQLLHRQRAGATSVRERNPAVCETTSSLIMACLSVDPESRPTSAREVAQVLRQSQLERKLAIHEERARQEEKAQQAREESVRSTAARQAFHWAAVGAFMMATVAGSWIWVSQNQIKASSSEYFSSVEEAIEQIRTSYFFDDIGNAVRQARAAMAEHDDPRLHHIYAELLRSIGSRRRDELLDHYGEACKGPFDARAWSNWAVLLSSNRDTQDEALSALKKCIEHDDSFWQPHFVYLKMATTHAASKRPRDAKALYHVRQFLKLLPTDQREPYHYKIAIEHLLANKDIESAGTLLLEGIKAGLKRDQELDRILKKYQGDIQSWEETVFPQLAAGTNDGHSFLNLLLTPNELRGSWTEGQTQSMADLIVE